MEGALNEELFPAPLRECLVAVPLAVLRLRLDSWAHGVSVTSPIRPTPLIMPADGEGKVVGKTGGGGQNRQ